MTRKERIDTQRSETGNENGHEHRLAVETCSTSSWSDAWHLEGFL